MPPPATRTVPGGFPGGDGLLPFRGRSPNREKAQEAPRVEATTTAQSTLALKEWGAVVHALLDGRQTVLLRKGGIHERSFAVLGARFVLFPTIEHSHRHRVRPEHADLLTRVAPDLADDRLVLRCGVTLLDTVTVSRPEGLRELADLHIYTDEHLAERLAFRPRHPLHVLVAQAEALPVPVSIERLEEHSGCRSWLELPVKWDEKVTAPVQTPAQLSSVAGRVRSALAPG